MIGYYYLHSKSKDLIYKPVSVVDSDASYFDSPFVQKVWKFDSEDRFDAWQICVAKCGYDSIEEAKMSAKKDGDQWCVAHNDDTDPEGFVNLQEDQAGFGDRIFEALVDYAKQGKLV